MTEFAGLVTSLKGFGPVPRRYPTENRSHRQRRGKLPESADEALCPIVLPEYVAMGLPPREECAAYAERHPVDPRSLFAPVGDEDAARQKTPRGKAKAWKPQRNRTKRFFNPRPNLYGSSNVLAGAPRGEGEALYTSY